MKVKLLFLLIFTSCIALAQVPQWYISHTDPIYPHDEFIIGVGSAAGERGIEKAKKNAFADIVSQIRVKVQSETNSLTQSFQINKDEKIYSDFKSRTQTIVSDEINGAQIVETSFDMKTNTGYALAVLNRLTNSQSIGSELAAGWKQASHLRNEAKNFVLKGRLMEAIQDIQQARKLIAPLIAKQIFYNTIAGAPFQSKFAFSPLELQEDIRTLLSYVYITKISGDKQRGKIGSNFSKPLKLKVFLKNDSISIPCIGVPVEFIYEGKTLLGKSITNNQGITSFTARILPMREYGINARIFLPGLQNDFMENLESSSVNFTWTSLSSDKKFILNVSGKNKKILIAVRARFAEAITDAGYDIAPLAGNILTIKVRTGIPEIVTGFSGTIYTVKLRTTAALTKRNSNTILGTAVFTSLGVGKSKDEAAKRAAESLAIEGEKIGWLLEK